MGCFKLTAVAFAVMSLFSVRAQAIDREILKDSNGVPIIEMRFYSPGDGNYYEYDNGQPYGSSWVLSQTQKDQMIAGLNYWANIIQVKPGKSPAIINVGTITVSGANAISPTVKGWPIAPSQVGAALQNLGAGPLKYGAHGFINIGTLAFGTDPYIPSQLPMVSSGEADLSVVILHEFAHALGIGSTVIDVRLQPGHTPYFDSTLSTWSAGLRDDNGKAAQAGQAIWCNGCNNPASADVFDVSLDKGYFTGKHVDEVLAGAMRGIPVVISDEFGSVDTDYMSHIELKNSLMSHQDYRNYTTFMEAELAVLQDLGYTIDRRNFFGSSVYGNGQTIVNDNGYFGRNANGTAYINNTYNQAILGLGLHIYGSNNNLYQRADILSAGVGGGGIRVDGEGNTLTILPGTRVYADGDYARGIMFAYGKNHQFVQQGDVQALGYNGIAASFDFGNNILGNAQDYRGSYIYIQNEFWSPLLDELNGPLVTSYDLTGSLAGRYASIYIARSAYVGQINIMQGASLAGDIYSFYNQTDASNAQRLTALNFGMKADANGQAIAQADTDFTLRYDGNISGIDNLSLQALGGLTDINGSHQLYDATIAQGATLSGNSSYQLNSQGVFTNHGTFKTATTGSTGITGDAEPAAVGLWQVQ